MLVDRKKAPAIHDAIEFEYILPSIEQIKLSNGLPLYWLNSGVQDVVEIDWVFPGGLWYETKDAIAHATAGLLKNGTSKHTSQQINEALEFYGASLKVNASNDFATVTLYSLTKHLPKILPIVFEIITEASFPEDEVNIYKQNAIQRLMVNLRQSEFVANQRIDAILFGDDHPYGRFTKKETIENLGRSDLMAFYHKQYNLSNVKIFMAGNIGTVEVKNIEEVFGKVAITPTLPDTLSFQSPAIVERKQNILNDPNGVQAAIRIGRLFPNRHHADFTPMVVLNTLFGGYFGSRLMSNIREDKGYTYGIYSSLSPFVNGGSLTIHTEVGRDVMESAVKEVYHEMQLICNEKVQEEELLLVKNYLLGNMLGDLDGPFSILQRWRTLILNGFTSENFDKNIQIYKSISAEELLTLAQKYFKSDDYYEVVVV
ncbi:MAG: pitrilysin family protein [Bacteroidota bacterium]